MSDGQTFIFVLASFYIWESVYWVLPNSSGWTRFFKSWKHSRATDLLYGRQKAILFNPWPGILFPQCLAAELPVHLTRDRLILPDARYIDWQDLELKQEASDLYLRNDYKLKLPNANYASILFKLLRDIKETAPHLRERKIELFYRSHFSPTRVSRLVYRANAITHLLRLNGFFLTLLFFGAIPYSYISRKETVFPYVLLAAFGFVLYQAIVAFFTAKRLDPKSKKQRWVLALSSLFPWQAMHVGQQLISHTLPLQHPLAVSAALSKPDALKKQLSTYLRRLTYSMEAPPPEPFLKALNRLIEDGGFSKVDLLAPPLKADQQSASYCPCCHSQFQKGSSICSDCHDVELVLFEGPESQTPAKEDLA